MLDLPRERWTIVELVREQAARYGERTFARTADGAALSFRALDERSTALAATLARLGVEPGDRVLALLPNGTDLLVTLVAANKRNAIFVPINVELKGAFLEHQLGNSDPRVLVVEASLLRAFESVRPEVGSFESVLLAGDARGAALPAALANRRLVRLEDAFAEPSPADLVEPAPSDVSAIIYTSGTTGPSKGVLMPHAHCVLLGHTLAETLSLAESDVYYVCMPLFHTNALFMQVVGSLLAGASVALVRRFSASRWLDDVRRFGATVTNGLGVMPEFVFRRPPTPHDRDHRLRCMMAVPIAREWGEAFERRFGVKLVQGFGLTESNIVAYTSFDDPLEPGCCGRVLDQWFEVRVVDPATDEPLPAGERGEIVIRPKRPFCFMAGYFRMPEKTVEAWRNLWFHTGDAGRFDERGRLFYVDRIKDCIRRRGENVSSFEVEQVLNAHPDIAESAVVAEPSTIPGGEDEVRACVVLRAGAALTPGALVEYCRQRMPRYAVPRYLELCAALPKTPTGKLRKEELRRRGLARDAWDREAAAPPPDR